jgi:AcrR family transcriptional regulator
LTCRTASKPDGIVPTMSVDAGADPGAGAGAPVEPTSRAEQARQTRARILTTAQALFAERGYDGTSLQQIADELGLTKAAVYYHFRTKSELLQALFESEVDAFQAMLDEVDGARTAAERRRLLVAMIVDRLVSRRDRALEIEGDPAVTFELHKSKQPFQDLLDRAARVLYGPEPSAAERLAVYSVPALPKAIRQLPDMTDEELRTALSDLLTRVLRVR